MPVNIGNPVEMTILDFAKAVVEIARSDSDIVHVQPKDERITDDPKMRQPDITKARRILGWEPKIDLADGLIETINYFRDKV
jgi:dTDP-glucose 4,6-dehydratase